ncbi:MAG: DUF1549 domain-containing protein [Pirellulales bacterium]
MEPREREPQRWLRGRSGAVVVAAGWLVVWLSSGSAAAPPPDFSHDIVPLLRQHCGQCHAGTQQKGGFSLNTRTSLLKGGEGGAAVVPGRSNSSALLQRVRSNDDGERMPPEGPRLTDAQIQLLARWIDAGVPWDEGFTFGVRSYEPPLRPRRPELPPAVDGRDHPIDRILDAELAARGAPRPGPVSDEVFARRVHLDLVGLLPTPEALDAFVADRAPDKRARLIDELLGNQVAYAEHWLTFWNDLLRNDYTGTGFITGGRKQISAWLYRSLVDNKPYDQFARELIAPTPESEGFSAGIRWRGDVSAGQTVEIQFAQSVGQAFLGINLKCASCHDSFIDRWTLAESYGLAAIYSAQPLELHRCDKPLGKKAQPAWLFPEIGQVDPTQPPAERLRQLAALLTHAENGRFTRTIVNRLWHRLMGRGIVHPTDAMQTAPWNADLLDYLAVDLAEHGYDLKHTLARIAKSQAYQSQCQVVTRETDEHGYVYAGPRARRLTAEQFLDAVWQLTGAAPRKIDAPIVRGLTSARPAQPQPLAGTWIWSGDGTGNPLPPAGQQVTFRHRFRLTAAPLRATAALTVDNRYVLYVNGKRVAADDSWESVEVVSLGDSLRAGENEILLVGQNGGNGPNPAGAYLEAWLVLPDNSTQSIVTHTEWEWTIEVPNGAGKFRAAAPVWQRVTAVSRPETWSASVASELAGARQAASQGAAPMVRASLLKNDFLMRALGRPHREQIVSVRPVELTTLEAIDLNNGQTLATYLEQGGVALAARPWKSTDELAHWIFRFALGRAPTTDELALARSTLGEKPAAQPIEDLLWAVLMLPEFQLVR